MALAGEKNKGEKPRFFPFVCLCGSVLNNPGRYLALSDAPDESVQSIR